MLDTLSMCVTGVISVLRNYMVAKVLLWHFSGRRAARRGVALAGHSAWNLAGLVRARGMESDRLIHVKSVGFASPTVMPVTPRLRSACDACHQLKVRCSGYLPCDSCTESCRTCVFSPASVPSDNSSSPKSSGQSSVTDVHSISWTTSPFEYALPFPEDKWGLQEDFAAANMPRGIFHHEEMFEKEHEPTFSGASVVGQSESIRQFASQPTTLPISIELS
ncbi:uncharacterized protein TRIVIDRAFT_64887 [Trichoderma virens Gv29-8]|uniref:Zn(2)-C6 fungal-type domain-containing protein n=1 Tax=Hypocrea virens (strain Gv29-8 / FGSC 10586) TaxID=413071 RepID=G9NBV4_HYPVG|nr:uncharacterized protein TRIVIDRAFT_64887 [Trichoderma virens Gv29-8]EHK16307.1 hypothetical protein TRIVIDRAFT_64887 [Trichoderma virens Gv29-8]UKZ55918.1 hypothetical protein TrVGV298_009742 [Trichoderma virens]